MNRQNQWLFEAPVVSEAILYTNPYSKPEWESEWELPEALLLNEEEWETVGSLKLPKRVTRRQSPPLQSPRKSGVPVKMRPTVSSSRPLAKPPIARAKPRVLTYTTKDVIDKRISVPAQHSLVRLSKNPATSADAVGLLEEVKAGRLDGIYCANWEKAAQRALKLGKNWWTVIPKGENSILMLDPDNLLHGSPLIAFRRELDSNCGLLQGEKQVTVSPSKLDASLLRAWRVYLRFRKREILPCKLTYEVSKTLFESSKGIESKPVSDPTAPQCCNSLNLTIIAWAGGFPRSKKPGITSDDMEIIVDRSQANVKVKVDRLQTLLDYINSLPPFTIKKLFLIGHSGGQNRLLFQTDKGETNVEKRKYDEDYKISLSIKNLKSKYVSDYIKRNQLSNRFAAYSEIIVVACSQGQSIMPLPEEFEEDLFKVMAEKFGVCVKGFIHRVCIFPRTQIGRIIEKALLMYPPPNEACQPGWKDRSRIARRVEELNPDRYENCPDT